MTARTGTAARLLEVLAPEVGYREGTGNRNKYAAIAGHANGFAWCATFVCATAKMAGVTGVPNSAWTPYQESQYKANGRLHTTPIVGAQFFVYFVGEGRVAHTGWVTGIAAGGRSVYTVEGNSNDNGSREGIEVVRRVRPVLRASGSSGIRSYGYPTFVRPPTSTTTTAPAKPVAFSVRALRNALFVRPRSDVWDATLTKGSGIVRRAGQHGVTRSWTDTDVRYLQGRVGTEIDGDWGSDSATALSRAIKRVQVVLGVAPDGRWGPLTDAAYLRAKSRHAK